MVTEYVENFQIFHIELTKFDSERKMEGMVVVASVYRLRLISEQFYNRPSKRVKKTSDCMYKWSVSEVVGCFSGSYSSYGSWQASERNSNICRRGITERARVTRCFQTITHSLVYIILYVHNERRFDNDNDSAVCTHSVRSLNCCVDFGKNHFFSTRELWESFVFAVGFKNYNLNLFENDNSILLSNEMLYQNFI